MLHGQLMFVKPRLDDTTSQRNISQHCWPSICKLRPNDRNIAGCNMLHGFGHQVATCCDMLRVENRTSAHAQAQHFCTNLAKRLQHHVTSTKCYLRNLTIFKSEPTTLNMSQHVATGWPNVTGLFMYIYL